MFFSSGREGVVVNGAFFTPVERAAYLEHMRTPVEPFFVTLRVSFEESWRRAQVHRFPRGSARDRAWLAERHATSDALLACLPPDELVIDTDGGAPAGIATTIRQRLT